MRSRRTFIWTSITALLMSCGGEAPTHDQPQQPLAGGKTDKIAASASAVLTFDSAWNEQASGDIVAGGTIAIDYDEARLPTCRASDNGNPGWQITAFVQYLPAGSVVQAEMFAHGASATGVPDPSSWVPQQPKLTVPLGTTSLEVWFRNTSSFDKPCTAWDSNYGKNYVFAVEPAPALPTLSFRADWQVEQSGSIVPGGKLAVIYAAERMEQIAWGPNPYYSFFASTYHCYGYGCCEQRYDNALHVRFHDSGAFAAHDIDSGVVELTVPADATRVETYFSSAVYTTTWYCGGAPGPKHTHPPDQFYDSNFGKNFLTQL